MKVLAFACLLASNALQPDPLQGRRLALDMHRWQVVQSASGPTNYYRVVEGQDGPYIHSDYQPPDKTMTQAYRLPDVDRQGFHHLAWRWRAIVLPQGGDECAKGHEDSAADIYVTWRRGLKWYGLKYVWSAVGPKGAVCDRKSNPFRAQDTVILESGGPLQQWVDERIDLDSELRRHFANGDPMAAIPDLMGVGLMSDGDQTHSESSADFGDFALSAG